MAQIIHLRWPQGFHLPPDQMGSQSIAILAKKVCFCPQYFLLKIEPKSLVPISAFLLWFSSLRGNCILGGKRMITWCFVDAFFFLEIWYPKFMYATNQLLLSTKKVYSFVSNRKCDFNFIGCNLTVHVYMCVIACKCNVFHQTLTTPQTEKWQDKYVSLNNLITV